MNLISNMMFKTLICFFSYSVSFKTSYLDISYPMNFNCDLFILFYPLCFIRSVLSALFYPLCFIRSVFFFPSFFFPVLFPSFFFSFPPRFIFFSSLSPLSSVFMFMFVILISFLSLFSRSYCLYSTNYYFALLCLIIIIINANHDIFTLICTFFLDITYSKNGVIPWSKFVSL